MSVSQLIDELMKCQQDAMVVTVWDGYFSEDVAVSDLIRLYRNGDQLERADPRFKDELTIPAYQIT